MRRVVACFTIAAGTAGVTATAAAQPTAAPVEPEVDAYPIEHTARPLLLPAGAIEATALLEVTDYDFDGSGEHIIALAPRACFGVSNAEVEVGARLIVDESDGIASSSNALQNLDLAGRFGLSDGLAAGLELGVAYPTEDFRSINTMAVVSNKQHFRAGSLELAGGVGYVFGREDTQDILNAQVRLAATAQPMPALAFQVRAVLGASDRLGESDPFFPDPGVVLYQQYGARALFAATPNLDLIAGFDVPSTGQYTARVYTIGIAGRRVP